MTDAPGSGIEGPTLMTQFSCRLFRIGRKSGPEVKRPRRVVSPRLGEDCGHEHLLERRSLLSIVALTANASPTILRRINPMNQPHAVQVATVRPVTLSGNVTLAPQGANVVPSLSFHVVDEYGRDQPSGTFEAQPVQPGTFFFSTRIGLDLTRRHGDRDGRQYTIFVTAVDPESTRTIVFTAMTPHGRQARGSHNG
jgi:hypothetical protein